MADSFLLGTYAGSQHTDAVRATAMERWLDVPVAVQNVFTAWDTREPALDYLFDRVLSTIWAEGRIPMVTWEPFTPTPDATPSDIATRISAGEFDGYLERWVDRLAAWLRASDDAAGMVDGRRIYLRFAHEMNGDWYPWSPTEAADDEYVEMWRHVRGRFDREPFSERVQWVWAVNHTDIGPISAETLYPGDAYVDWVGVDGFNWGESRKRSEWLSAEAVFDDMIDRLRMLADKPLCIPEVGTSSLTATGHNTARKSGWIADAIAYFREVDVQMLVWFNVDKETDWAVFGGERGDSIARIDGQEYEAYSEFKRTVRELSLDSGES